MLCYVANKSWAWVTRFLPLHFIYSMKHVTRKNQRFLLIALNRYSIRFSWVQNGKKKDLKQKWTKNGKNWTHSKMQISIGFCLDFFSRNKSSVITIVKRHLLSSAQIFVSSAAKTNGYGTYFAKTQYIDNFLMDKLFPLRVG